MQIAAFEADNNIITALYHKNLLNNNSMVYLYVRWF